ncbi:MAG: hypothetical protein D6737_07025, partial [Chloroflexi bacterium]
LFCISLMVQSDRYIIVCVFILYEAEEIMLKGETVPRPLGGEIYEEFQDKNGNRIVLTYNDLWLLIVCQTSMDGDWARVREAAGMVPDPTRKRELANRLWKLEQELDGLPPIPDKIQKINLHRAHNWFNQRTVSTAKSF